jgi:hypothetical protein
LQVKSDGIAKEQKIQLITNLKNIAALWEYVDNRSRQKEQEEKLPDDVKECLKIIDRYWKTGNMWMLWQINIGLTKYFIQN